MRRRNDRVGELEAELERRLQELAQREAALKKIADAVMKNRPAAPPPSPPGEDHAARLQELDAREAALKRISEVVERRRTELEATVRESEERASAAETRAGELQAQLAAVSSAAEARTAELQEQLAAASADAGRIAELEAEVAQLRADLSAAQETPPAPVPAAPEPVAAPRGRGLFGRRRRGDEPLAAVEPPALLPPPAVKPEPEPEPEPEPAAPAPEPLAVEGRPTLPQLEHLADEAERRGLPNADEWQVYVRLLREHSWVDGTIPPQFDDILRDVFGAAF